MTAQAKMTARFASMTTDMIKQVLAGLVSINTPEGRIVWQQAYVALEGRIGEDATYDYTDEMYAAAA